MRESRSGSLRSESVERQLRSARSSRNHSLHRERPGYVTGQRNSGMNEEIGAADSGVVMRRISSSCLGMMRINADTAQ